VKAREVNRRIERLGGRVVRQTGSHRRYVVTFIDPAGREAKAFTSVAQHAGEIPSGTLRAIERDLEIALSERTAEMSTEHVYRVIVTREDGAWLADVPELKGAHTYARTLPALDRAVREVVVMAVDRPDEDMPALRLAYAYRTGDPTVDVTAAEIRNLREHADQLAATATARTSAAARLLIQSGFSVRDTAAILGISPQRVSQLTGVVRGGLPAMKGAQGGSSAIVADSA
jgi:predicted RNA binding protein YcfA (HicA-like mRNA interferase family)